MRNKKLKTIFIIAVSAIAITLIIAGSILYKAVYSANINIGHNEGKHIFIPTGSTCEDVFEILFEEDLIINKKSFLWLAKKKNYKSHVYPGRYAILGDMSNNDLINTLRSGRQDPVMLVINNIRTKEELAQLVSNKLETDSLTVLTTLNNNVFLKEFDLNSDNVMTVFIPNTYEFFWNTSATSFFKRMLREHDKFWSDERRALASSIPLSTKEISILASIVQMETTKEDEMSEIAGVYINRLKNGMPLQADPTIIFALKDFSKKRVLKADTKIESPYNTYKIKGLPPGPICLPEPLTIDKVLNYKKHNYYYFCAKDDLSGYHHFSKSLREHLRYARRYQRELNNRRIRK
jgi:UPF0755 protein